MATEQSDQDIVVQQLPAQPIITVRTTSALDQLSESMGPLLGQTWQYLQDRGVHPASPPFSRYHNFTDTDVDFESGFITPQPVEGEGNVTAGELPGGDIATTWHVGHYDALMESYARLDSWLAANNREKSAPAWEVYWTDPGESPDPATWRTQIFQPIK